MPERNPVVTRARIMAAALQLFSERPYDRVGIRDIAASAGVNAALISRYFGSKKGLFREVVMSSGHGMPPSATPAELKTNIMNAIFETLDEAPGGRRLSSLKLVLSSAMTPEVTDIILEYMNERSSEIRKYLAGETEADFRIDLIISTVFGMLFVFRILQKKRANEVDGDMFRAYIDKVFDFILHNQPDRDPSVNSSL